MKRFQQLRQPAAAAAMLIAFITVASGALALCYQLWPGLKPDPGESLGAELKVVASTQRPPILVLPAKPCAHAFRSPPITKARKHWAYAPKTALICPPTAELGDRQAAGRPLLPAPRQSSRRPRRRPSPGTRSLHAFGPVVAHASAWREKQH